MWHKAKRVQLQSGQSEVRVDFPLPIVACNLMMEYADFYENQQATGKDQALGSFVEIVRKSCWTEDDFSLQKLLLSFTGLSATLVIMLLNDRLETGVNFILWVCIILQYQLLYLKKDSVSTCDGVFKTSVF